MTRSVRRPLLVLASLSGWAIALPARAQVTEYYHLDGIGSVRVVTDQSQAVVERHDLLPFGEEWCGTAVCGSDAQAGGQARKFTGKERDTETDLDYFGARYFGSKIARFTTPDPVTTPAENTADPQRWNKYAYGRDNPFRFVDPDGRDWLEYHGQTVTWYGGAPGNRSQPSGTYPASSGLPGVQEPKNQDVPDYGPIPEGRYAINLRPDPGRVAKADSRTGALIGNSAGGIEQIPESFTASNGLTYTYGAHGRRGDWGNVRASMQAQPGTDTHGRGSFYLHDSDKGYSHGCVDTKPAVLQRLIAYRNDHPEERRFEVRVHYTDLTTKRKE